MDIALKQRQIFLTVIRQSSKLLLKFLSCELHVESVKRLHNPIKAKKPQNNIDHNDKVYSSLGGNTGHFYFNHNDMFDNDEDICIVPIALKFIDNNRPNLDLPSSIPRRLRSVILL